MPPAEEAAPSPTRRPGSKHPAACRLHLLCSPCLPLLPMCRARTFPSVSVKLPRSFLPPLSRRFAPFNTKAALHPPGLLPSLPPVIPLCFAATLCCSALQLAPACPRHHKHHCMPPALSGASPTHRSSCLGHRAGRAAPGASSPPILFLSAHPSKWRMCKCHCPSHPFDRCLCPRLLPPLLHRLSEHCTLETAA